MDPIQKKSKTARMSTGGRYSGTFSTPQRINTLDNPPVCIFKQRKSARMSTGGICPRNLFEKPYGDDE